MTDAVRGGCSAIVREGIGLVDAEAAVARLDVELVALPLVGGGEDAVPDPRAPEGLERVGCQAPIR